MGNTAAERSAAMAVPGLPVQLAVPTLRVMEFGQAVLITELVAATYPQAMAQPVSLYLSERVL
jgi:hypothetical protein